MNKSTLWGLFRYEAPHLYWRMRGRKKSMTKPAGCLNRQGYWQIGINGKLYKRSRLVFFMHKGFWPEQVDHINRVRGDDRIENLRASNSFGNSRNTAGRGATPWKYISKAKVSDCKQGFIYKFYMVIRGKNTPIKASTNLDKLVTFRNGYLQRFHPDKLAICNRHDC